jgi:hypothetical protein
MKVNPFPDEKRSDAGLLPRHTYPICAADPGEGMRVARTGDAVQDE